MYKIPVKRLCISDIHLGGGYTRIKGLLDVLNTYKCRELILCGDILDFWRMKYKIKWDGEKYSELIETILDIAKTTRVIYIPGNHDEYLKIFDGHKAFGIEIMNHYVADDTLFIHGDSFDNLSEEQRIIYHLGDFAYNMIQRMNRWLRFPLSKVIRDPFAPSKLIKQTGKKIFSHLNGFYENAASTAKRLNCGTIVCGHTHIAEKKRVNGIDYYNCGDWVESGTYLIQYSSKEIVIVDYDLQQSNEDHGY